MLNYKHPHHNKITWTKARVLMCSWSCFYCGSSSSVTGSSGSPGASLSGNETAGSIIRSDGKSLCKVFCIITYQSQNSHPQILWVTKHQQLPHYCPPKSSPTNDKGAEKRRRRRRSRERSGLPNPSWGDWIFLPVSSKEDYCQTDNLFTHSCKVWRTSQGFKGSCRVLNMWASWNGFSISPCCARTESRQRKLSATI